MPVEAAVSLEVKTLRSISTEGDIMREHGRTHNTGSITSVKIRANVKGKFIAITAALLVSVGGPTSA